jgi:crotonobetainyl-CoA:carnitine CoA-transferase CaiB-like acyl-CoA transferase
MALLAGLRVVQAGPGLAAAVCGRMLADTGASVACLDADRSSVLAVWLNDGKSDTADPATADLIITQDGPGVSGLRAANPRAPIVAIAPFGLTGPDAARPATDLTLFAASGMMRLLTGQVDDTSEPPIRPVGEQSAFIAGLAAACAGMHAVMGPPGSVVDISMQEALATLAMTELTRAGQTGRGWRRKREADGNGATVCILPAADGYAAISPREDRQWASWLRAMGSPAWGDDPRFRTKPDRVANWDALHALMSDWSRPLTKQRIADIAQEAHVPSFPLMEVAEHLGSAQLAHRGFFRPLAVGGRTVRSPAAPFGLTLTDGPPRPRAAGGMPLSGVRVLDFSWVIAGPTTTRTLAAMGADVIKVEAPGRGDPGRASELHTVLGQAKRAIVLDLKQPEAVAIARDLAARCDVLIENFATGVMDRLGLGADDLRAVNPDLIYVSASGLGRTGPEAQAVAYGTLLQSYAGFAGLNRFPERPPRIGFAWADPMCALMLAFVTAAALWRRGHAGGAARVDFSMIEAMLWTMAEPVLRAQIEGPPGPVGLASDRFAPHGVYPCMGEDQWVAVAVPDDAAWRGLCGVVPKLAALSDLDTAARRAAEAAIAEPLSAWTGGMPAAEAAAALRAVGVAAEAVAGSLDLLRSSHLADRRFWDTHGTGLLPGLPWRASFGRVNGPAPGLGEHTEEVLREVLHLPAERVAALRGTGALG